MKHRNAVTAAGVDVNTEMFVDCGGGAVLRLILTALQRLKLPKDKSES